MKQTACASGCCWGDRMKGNRVVIIALCVVLCIALGALIVVERRYPEAGSELVRRLMHRGA